MPASPTTRSRYLAPLALALLVALAGTGTAQQSSTSVMTVTLAGQSMIRSDIRDTAPAAVPVIQSLLKGDVVFTNFESAIAERGQSVSEGRGFLTPPGALDA